MRSPSGINYNLDRILRVTVLANPKTDENGNKVPEQCVVEYCPMDNEKLNAKIDVTIKEIPVVNDIHNTPGFSAIVKIYNPPPELISMINYHAPWVLSHGSIDSYYAQRCTVIIDAGYWNHDSRNGREYTRVFGETGKGWLNTSAYYRKGVDNILEMYCHNIRLNAQDVTKMTAAPEVSKYNYQKAQYQKIKTSVAGNSSKPWDTLVRETIKQYAEFKAPLSLVGDMFSKTKGGLGQSEVTNSTVLPVRVTPEDRKSPTDFFEIKYIMEPRDVNNPESSKPDMSIELVAKDASTAGIVPDGKTFEERMLLLCRRFPGGLRYTASYQFQDGKTRYYFWQPEGTTIKPKNKESATWGNNKPDFTIYNLQNCLEVPSVDGAGCFTIKMMFNPRIKPNSGLRLAWSDDMGMGQAISDLLEGISTGAQIGQYYPSLQAGKYQANIAALRNDNGYLFNRTFRVSFITHTLSTHTNKWSTEAKTTSLMAGRD